MAHREAVPKTLCCNTLYVRAKPPDSGVDNVKIPLYNKKELYITQNQE